MQQVQDQLAFNIETPSDEELTKRFDELSDVKPPILGHRKLLKKRNQKTKHQKKLERLQREPDRVSNVLDSVMNTTPD